MDVELILKPEFKLTLSMTLQLQQSIKLLQLSRMELVEEIQQEMEDNPTLEAVDESEEKESLDELKELSNYLDECDSRWRNIIESEVREPLNFENYTIYTESLTDHLLHQLLMASPTKEEETIGSFIAGSLDKNGYLKASVDQIAAMSNSGLDKTHQVLSLMQTFDPLGVCARDLRECLLIQMKNQGVENKVAKRIIQNHLKDLENKNYKIAGA
ncbi:MAG: RNA polymerase factor sigma-54 [Planctomycetota bacterium]|jgi:RNA polymerase sigma-54 factor